MLSVPSAVTSLDFDNGYAVLEVDSGETVVAKCLLIASGAEYLRLSAEHCSDFEGSGVYYAATPNEGRLCRGLDVVVVGGGNSAGQAAVYLSRESRRVLLVVRGDNLAKSMSSYLEHRIDQTPNIDVLLNTEVVRMDGEGGHLRSVDIVNRQTGEERTVITSGVFSFIGAVPRTDWTRGRLETDARGFIRTGSGSDPPRHAGTPTRAVPAGDQPGRRFRRRRRAGRVGQTRRISRRRRIDVGTVRPRASQGELTHKQTFQAASLLPPARILSQGAGMDYRHPRPSGAHPDSPKRLESNKAGGRQTRAALRSKCSGHFSE